MITAAAATVAHAPPIEIPVPGRSRHEAVPPSSCTGRLPRPSRGRRSSATTKRAGSTITMHASEMTSPTPATIPSSRRPWNSVNHASRKTPAAVSAPRTFAGTAVRIMYCTDPATGRCRRASW